MKKVDTTPDAELRPEYRREDFGTGVRGKYYEADSTGTDGLATTEDQEKILQEKHRILRRLVIAQGDLLQALRFAELILSYEDIEADSTEEAWRYKDLLTALNIAMVIAYSRPFLDSKTGRKNSATSKLPGKILRGLSVEQRKLHGQLLRQRNQEFARSDVDAYSPMIFNNEFFLAPIMRNPFPPQDLDRIDSIKELIQVLVPKISEEIQALRYTVDKGKTLYA